MYPLTVDDYRTAIASLPRPTEQQMEAFAQYVSGAHSWYKHLPMYPPGHPFYFYLDPCAGLQRVVGADGTLRCVESDTPGFHYASLATAEYRRRFGHLAYAQSSSTSVELHLGDGRRIVPADEDVRVFDAAMDAWRRLPDDVLHAGRTLVSALVYPGALCYLNMLLRSAGPGRAPWPRASGGEAAFAAALERIRYVRGHPEAFRPLPEDHPACRTTVGCRIDTEVYELLEPEWRRQQRGMVDAMQRVRDGFQRPPAELETGLAAP